MITVLRNGRVVTPGATLRSGWIAFEDGRILGAGEGRPPAGDISLDVNGDWVLPGFVDIHAHGGDGFFAQSGKQDELTEIAAFHARHGTTSLVLSVVADELGSMERAIAAIAARAQFSGSSVVGSHLEGPFLSAARCGAIRPEVLRSPDPNELGRLLDAAAGTARQLTVAPELPGALELIGIALGAGVVPAIGHSNADAATTRQAVAAGARIATHLYNAMSGLAHRGPGVAAVALLEPEVICELILDGHHIDPELAQIAFAVAGPGRIALVTDAMAAAGLSDGAYVLAGQALTVDDATARTANGSLAGSLLTMDASLRYAVTVLGLSVEQASISASSTPARAIGLEGRTGALHAGLDADLVLLDVDLNVRATYLHGALVDGKIPKDPRQSQLETAATASA